MAKDNLTKEDLSIAFQDSLPKALEKFASSEQCKELVKAHTQKTIREIPLDEIVDKRLKACGFPVNENNRLDLPESSDMMRWVYRSYKRCTSFWESAIAKFGIADIHNNCEQHGRQKRFGRAFKEYA